MFTIIDTIIDRPMSKGAPTTFHELSGDQTIDHRPWPFPKNVPQDLAIYRT